MILIVSWIRLLWLKFLFAIVIAKEGENSASGSNPPCALTVLAQKSDKCAVVAPDHILYRSSRNFRNLLALLNVI